MSKYCCVCGREINEHEPYYYAGHNTYTCSEGECWSTYRWDVLSARFIVNKDHEYFVVNHKLYQIGSNNDEPRGMRGRYYVIQFDDGTIRDTNSLWFIAEIPEDKRHIFKENARFIQKGEY